jgi:hypothetical protein
MPSFSPNQFCLPVCRTKRHPLGQLSDNAAVELRCEALGQGTSIYGQQPSENNAAGGRFPVDGSPSENGRALNPGTLHEQPINGGLNG